MAKAAKTPSARLSTGSSGTLKSRRVIAKKKKINERLRVDAQLTHTRDSDQESVGKTKRGQDGSIRSSHNCTKAARPGINGTTGKHKAIATMDGFRVSKMTPSKVSGPTRLWFPEIARQRLRSATLKPGSSFDGEHSTVLAYARINSEKTGKQNRAAKEPHRTSSVADEPQRSAKKLRANKGGGTGGCTRTLDPGTSVSAPLPGEIAAQTSDEAPTVINNNNNAPCAEDAPSRSATCSSDVVHERRTNGTLSPPVVAGVTESVRPTEQEITQPVGSALICADVFQTSGPASAETTPTPPQQVTLPPMMRVQPAAGRFTPTSHPVTSDTLTSSWVTPSVTHVTLGVTQVSVPAQIRPVPPPPCSTGDHTLVPAGVGGGDAPLLAGGDAPLLAGGDAPLLAGGNAPFLAGDDAVFLVGDDAPLLVGNDATPLPANQANQTNVLPPAYITELCPAEGLVAETSEMEAQKTLTEAQSATSHGNVSTNRDILPMDQDIDEVEPEGVTFSEKQNEDDQTGGGGGGGVYPTASTTLKSSGSRAQASQGQSSDDDDNDDDEGGGDPDARCWRENFLRQCAALVERRYRNACSITCVKPISEQFTHVYETTEAAAQLPTSELDIHQEIKGSVEVEYYTHGSFTTSETNQLLNNFVSVSSAFRMKFPYLLAAMQTGLESKKDMFDFDKLKDGHRIFAKLCYGLDKRSVMACVVQLRMMLAPEIAPHNGADLSRLVTRLFAGFGPDWLTLSKLTGHSQPKIKMVLAASQNIEPSGLTPQAWFHIHQTMIRQKKAPAPRKNNNNNNCNNGTSTKYPWQNNYTACRTPGSPSDRASSVSTTTIKQASATTFPVKSGAKFSHVTSSTPNTRRSITSSGGRSAWDVNVVKRQRENSSLAGEDASDVETRAVNSRRSPRCSSVCTESRSLRRSGVTVTTAANGTYPLQMQIVATSGRAQTTVGTPVLGVQTAPRRPTTVDLSLGSLKGSPGMKRSRSRLDEEDDDDDNSTLCRTGSDALGNNNRNGTPDAPAAGPNGTRRDTPLPFALSRSATTTQQEANRQAGGSTPQRESLVKRSRRTPFAEAEASLLNQTPTRAGTTMKTSSTQLAADFSQSIYVSNRVDMLPSTPPVPKMASLGHSPLTSRPVSGNFPGGGYSPVGGFQDASYKTSPMRLSGSIYRNFHGNSPKSPRVHITRL